MAPDDADLVSDHQVLHDLLLRCALRDERALAVFYSLTSPLVWHVTLASHASLPEAENAVVRTYATVWSQAGTFAAAHLTAWRWTLAILTDNLAAQPPVGPVSGHDR